MVILFSKRNSKREKEVLDILLNYGGAYISDRTILQGSNNFTVISEYKSISLKIKTAIAVFTEDTERFENQRFPQGIIGICEEKNKNALKIFEKDNIPAICCGMSGKNTITVSSLSEEKMVVSLQRTITGLYKNTVLPQDFKITLNKKYDPFSVMISAAILLLLGKTPKEF